jgi:hypothetical protein
VWKKKIARQAAVMNTRLRRRRRSRGCALKKQLSSYKDLYKEIGDYTIISILKKDLNQDVDITMISEDFTGKTKSNNDSKFKNIFKGVQFRGVINKNGSIESFYLKQNQKNLLSVFFQLPVKPVKINDEWKLDINWIEMDQSFICNNKEKINKVKLIDIKKNGDEIIAVLQYKIDEKVEGSIIFPNNNGNKDIKIEMDFEGISEFSITNGKWIKYSGILSYITSGYQNKNIKQKFLLQEIDKMPKEIEKYFK